MGGREEEDSDALNGGTAFTGDPPGAIRVSGMKEKGVYV